MRGTAGGRALVHRIAWFGKYVDFDYNRRWSNAGGICRPILSIRSCESTISTSELCAETRARFMEAMAALRKQAGEAPDDDTAALLMQQGLATLGRAGAGTDKERDCRTAVERCSSASPTATREEMLRAALGFLTS